MILNTRSQELRMNTRVERTLSGTSIVGLFVSLFLLAFNAFSYILPDTIWVPVIYYDYHSDCSNPEFQPLCDGRPSGATEPTMNLVFPDSTDFDTLNAGWFGFDSIPKPVFNPAQLYFQSRVGYWFRPWASGGGKGDSTVPQYERYGEFQSPPEIQVDHDTAFKDFVIYDSLPFTHTGGNLYSFSENEFFPMDDRGFGDEGKRNNFAFTMEMHLPYLHHPDQLFEFGGDDDIWVFIDGKLRADIGGIHINSEMDFYSSDLSDLTMDSLYTMSVFFAERQSIQSNLQMTISMAHRHPYRNLGIKLIPESDSVRAGDEVPLHAQFVLDTLAFPDFAPEGAMSWGLVDDFNSDSSIDGGFYHARFLPKAAYTRSRVWVEYRDSFGHGWPITLTDTTDIHVLPGPSHHLTIEPTDDSTVSLRMDNPLQEIHLGPEDHEQTEFYAILRDIYGNWVEPARNVAWTVLDTNTAISCAGPDSSRGQGLVKRSSRREGTTSVVASHSGLSDSTVVLIDPYLFSELRLLVDADGPASTVDTLRATRGDSLKLLASGKRSDNEQWVATDVTWLNEGLTVYPRAPESTCTTWSFVVGTYNSAEPDTGLVSIAADGLTGAVLGGLTIIVDVDKVGVKNPDPAWIWPNVSENPGDSPSRPTIIENETTDTPPGSYTNSSQLLIAPNPMTPSGDWGMEFLRTAGEVKNAVRTMKHSGGVLFLIKNSTESLPESLSEPWKARNLNIRLQVRDVVGNPVSSREFRNISRPIPDADSYNFAAFWDGRTDSGSALTPGVYHVLLVMESGRVVRKFAGTLGVTN